MKKINNVYLGIRYCENCNEFHEFRTFLVDKYNFGRHLLRITLRIVTVVGAAMPKTKRHVVKVCSNCGTQANLTDYEKNLYEIAIKNRFNEEFVVSSFIGDIKNIIKEYGIEKEDSVISAVITKYQSIQSFPGEFYSNIVKQIIKDMKSNQYKNIEEKQIPSFLYRSTSKKQDVLESPIVQKNNFDKYDSIIVFDTETSGLDFNSDEIIDFGAVIIKKDTVSSYQKLIIPSRPINQEITNLTNITNEMLKEDGIKKYEFSKDFDNIFKEEKILLIGYNVNFDLNFLLNFLNKNGLISLESKFDYLDIMSVFKDIKYSYPHKLKDAIEFFEIKDVCNSHRAYDDAFATYKIFELMRSRYSDLDQYINVFGYNPKYYSTLNKINGVTYKPQPYEPHEKIYKK